MLFRRLANLPQASSYLLRSYYHHYYSYHHHFHFHFHLYLLFTTFVTTTSSFISPFLLLYLLFQPAYFLTYAFIIYLYYITCIYVSQNTHTWPPFDCVQRSILLNDVLKLGYQVWIFRLRLYTAPHSCFFPPTNCTMGTRIVRTILVRNWSESDPMRNRFSKIYRLIGCLASYRPIKTFEFCTTNEILRTIRIYQKSSKVDMLRLIDNIFLLRQYKIL